VIPSKRVPGSGGAASLGWIGTTLFAYAVPAFPIWGYMIFYSHWLGQELYIVTTIGSPVLILVAKIRKRRVTKNIPEVVNKGIRERNLNCGRSWQRSDKLNKMFHLAPQWLFLWG
jgi:hypothetical protein